jgi:hypothetical protein
LRLENALLYDFELAGRRVRLWKRPGESYEHVLMKALGFAMYVEDFPQLEIEARVGLRYKPDLVARRAGEDFRGRRFPFWGECGQTSLRKTAWLLKHADVGRLVLFKMIASPAALAATLRAEVGARYLAGSRLQVVNFVADVAELAAGRRVARVPQSWYTRTVV